MGTCLGRGRECGYRRALRVVSRYRGCGRGGSVGIPPSLTREPKRREATVAVRREAGAKRARRLWRMDLCSAA